MLGLPWASARLTAHTVRTIAQLPGKPLTVVGNPCKLFPMEAIAEFPFCESLPKVDESSLSKTERLQRRLAVIRTMAETDGQMIPVALAAELLGVSRQRVHEIVTQGNLKKHTIHGTSYVTENSLLEFVKTERKAGRPPKFPSSIRDCAKAAIKFGREA